VARSDHQHGTPPKYAQDKTFSRTGALTAPLVGVMRWYPGRAITIIGVRATVGSPSSGASVIVDVNKNGVSIFSTDLADAINLPSVGASDYVTVDIDTAGTTTPGSDLTVDIIYTVA